MAASLFRLLRVQSVVDSQITFEYVTFQMLGSMVNTHPASR